MPGIKQQFLGCEACSLVSVVMAVCETLYMKWILGMVNLW
jgi:hypothetical protein